MDFMRLLRSFEEFLFEAATWLLFYPLTVWRIVIHPITTMAYSDTEQGKPDEHRYDDAISPPLLLLITVVLTNLIGTALHMETSPEGKSTFTHAIFSSPQNLAIFRGLTFSLVPLVSAATLLRHQNIRLSRATLTPPFYAQCYLATPCCIVIGLGAAGVHRQDIPNFIAGGLMLGGACWFLLTQTRWYAERLSVSHLRAAGIATWALVRALAYLLALLIPIALL